MTEENNEPPKISPLPCNALISGSLIDRALSQAAQMEKTAGLLRELVDVLTKLGVAEQEEDHVLAVPVRSLRLSIRSSHGLRREGIETVRQLIELSAEDLLDVKNLGVTSLNEIREKLKDRGLALRLD